MTEKTDSLPADQVLPKGVQQDDQSSIEKWRNRMKDSQKWLVFNAMAQNTGAMDARKALTVLQKLSEETGVDMIGTMQDMEIRFPDLKDFDGEVYLHSPRGSILPVIYVYGVKDGERVFELSCFIYNNGIFPTSRNGESIQY